MPRINHDSSATIQNYCVSQTFRSLFLFDWLQQGCKALTIVNVQLEIQIIQQKVFNLDFSFLQDFYSEWRRSVMTSKGGQPTLHHRKKITKCA